MVASSGGESLVLLLAVARALATTWPAPASTMAEQISGADLAGEFAIVAVQTVLFEGVHATSHVELAPLSAVDGSLDHVTLVLPGGYVDGSFRTNGKDSFPVSVGERLLLTLSQVGVESRVQGPSADGAPVRVFNTSGSFTTSVLRATVSGARTIAHDAAGRAVILIPCDTRMMYAVAIQKDPGDAAVDDTVFVDPPDALGLDWDSAVADFLYCGGL